MIASIPFPNIDPVIFSVGPVSIRWYGLAYVAGFIAAGFLLRSLVRRWKINLTDDDVIDIILVAVVGLIVGARLGYVIAYGVGAYWDDPLSIFALWDGGMSFHGGLVGIMLAGAWIAHRKGITALRLFDLGAVGAPIGLFLGRIANFINGELWGRETAMPWGIVFPNAPTAVPRHPSQLYEALLEGLLLFVALFILSRKRREDGFIIGWFLALYGVFRITVEFFREPDTQLGFILGPVTMGQLLSVPMILIGAWFIWRALRAGRHEAEADGESPAAGK